MSDSDKKILSKKLDQILGEMVRYSFTLGDWGKYVWIVIYLGDNGYNARSFGVKSSEIRIFESQRSCNSCLGDIYISKYDYTTNSYNINFNSDIGELRENTIEVKNTIMNIETLAIGISNIVVNSYLDPSKEYKKMSIYFRRDVSDYNKIDEEIKESTIFGQSIPKKYEFINIPAFKFTALKEKKKDTKDDIIELSYPNHYIFSFVVYELSKFSLNFF